MMFLLEVVVKVSAVLGIGLAAAWLLRPKSAAIRHWILVSAIASAAMVPVFQVVVPAWLPHSRVEPVTPGGGEPAQGAGNIEPVVAAGTDGRDDAVSAQPGPASRSTAVTLVVVAWAAGAVVSLAGLAVGLIRLGAIERRARPLTTGPWIRAADELARLNGRPRPAVLLSDHPVLLATWGLMSPRVLLPHDAMHWSPGRVRLVLTHELAHIARGDWFAQMLAEIVRCAYWFNPLAWMACRRLRLEGEHACDDMVLSSGVRGEDYASELVDLARALNTNRPMWFPAPAMARLSDLEGRVTAMLNADTNRTPLTSRARLLVFGVLAALTLPLAGAVLFAQTYSSFSGTTRDQFGTPMSGVTLSLANTSGGQRYEVESDAVGAFEFVGLPNGEYALKSYAPGFESVARTVRIVGRNLQGDVELQVGNLEETISVRGTPNVRASGSPSVRRGTATPAKACVSSPISGKIIPPTKISDARPVYPGEAGLIELDVLIGVDGTIKDAKPIDSRGNLPELVNAAVEAVRLWEYTPTLVNCTPVEVRMKVHVSFLEGQ